MAIISRKEFYKNIDKPKAGVETQQKILDNAIREKNAIKETSLLRLHGIKSEVTYYEQIIGDRSGNLANNAALNSFDPNLIKLRKITNFIILTDELDFQLDKDVFTNLTYEGSAKILPHTIVPNINDFFIMKVFDIYHLFRIIEINPVLIEKDSGYEIRFNMYRQNIIPENCELNVSVKEIYSFDYNHVGTDFRTIFKSDESEFIQVSRDIMYNLTKVYSGIFYHKTLNTFMMEIGRLPDDIYNSLMQTVSDNFRSMIGNVLLENRTLYDVSLVNFINKFDIFSSSEYIHYVTEHVKPNRNCYNGSIFSAIENMKIERFTNDKQLFIYSDSYIYGYSNRLHGRFFIDHITGCNGEGEICTLGDWVSDSSMNTLSEAGNFFVLDLFPTNFLSILRNYDSDTMYEKTSDQYENVLDVMMDIISTFISEEAINRKRSIILKLVLLINDNFINFIYENDFESSKDIFYIYPLMIYVLKYMTRELSLREFK